METFYDRLDELYAAGDLAAIEVFILEAVADSPEDSPGRAGLLNELAGFYKGVSRYAESEDAFSGALSMFEAAGMGATAEYATVLLNLAGLYRIMGNADKAVELFIGAKGKLEDAGGRDSYAYVSVLNNLALAYQDRREFSEAMEYAENALALLRDGFGGEHEIAASLNNLSAIRLSLDELEAADVLISEALSIYDSMAEPDVHHAAALTTKAVVQCRSGDHRGALDGFRKALELTRRFFGENIEYAICRRNIADVFEIIGDLPSAAAELADAVRILTGILGGQHQSVINARGKLEQLEKRIG